MHCVLPPGGQDTERMQLPQQNMWLNAQTPKLKRSGFEMGTFHKSQLIKPPKRNGRFSPAVFFSFFHSTSCKFKSACAACVQPGKISSDSAPVMYLLGATFAETDKSVVDIHFSSSGKHPLQPLGLA